MELTAIKIESMINIQEIKVIRGLLEIPIINTPGITIMINKINTAKKYIFVEKISISIEKKKEEKISTLAITIRKNVFFTIFLLNVISFNSIEKIIIRNPNPAITNGMMFMKSMIGLNNH